ncbi:sodium:solute symporter [Aridibaculum aurantiacum]|uniref:sodium:solute symporter n=1 Tax=Aridibaculum aurantiacum TaxID=2810307 RepID=UPI001A977751|nr:sodium:solute symporter [Aridibaculum aurantiacum]
MSSIDWWVLCLTLLGIISYGLYKSRTSKNLEGYFLSNRSMPWYLVLLSIMGTQASAITFLSAPGQAFTDGMRFVQYYFGLPIAMVVICITFVPLFNRLKVFTAYEFLEQRFDLKTRTLTSFLFLLQRGLSTGISVYAPSIILSSLLGWNIFLTNIFMGGLLIIYTMSGGARAVAYTQQLQLIIIFIGMFLAGYMIVHLLPEGIGFSEALHISGASGKLNVITTGITENGFDWSDRYNMFSGVIGGFFLALSYFGTDQSQVQRFLTAKDTTESKRGLLMNGLVKVPMQFLILLIGALLFTFYQFKPSPVFHNRAVEEKAMLTPMRDTLESIRSQYSEISKRQTGISTTYLQAVKEPGEAAIKDSLQSGNRQLDSLRTVYKGLIKQAVPLADTNDTNYIFLRFVVDYLPVGLIGLLIAIIFLAAWGSIAAALNSLASCTMIDFHNRFRKGVVGGDAVQDKKDYRTSKLYTLAWGIFCIVVAQFANRMGSLIEAVNILGSLFYGVILGIFLVAFYLKKIGGNAVFWSAIIAEALVVTLFTLNAYDVIKLSFLWLNAVGALLVVFIALMMQAFLPRNNREELSPTDRS